MPNSPSNISDDLVQMGRPERIDRRHVNMPLELGSTIVFDTLAEFEAARDGRYGNAATFELGNMLARLEQADAVTLTSSGVAATTMTLLTFARPGAHLLVADNVYGNTSGFCDTVLTRMGVDVECYDPIIGTGTKALCCP